MGAADPEAVTLVLRFSTGVVPESQDRLVAVLADGSAPVARSFLVSTDGRRVASVVAVDEEQCDGEKRRRTGVGDDLWCLAIEDLDAAAELSGTVRGPDTELKLTTSVRHGSLGLPLVVSLGAILAGAAVAFVVATRRRSVREQTLDRLVARNEAALPGLAEWVQRRRVEVDVDDLVKAVNRLVDHGLRAVVGAKQDLTVALGASTLRSDHPVVVAGQDAAAAPIHVSQMVDPDGTALDLETRRLADLLSAVASCDRLVVQVRQGAAGRTGPAWDAVRARCSTWDADRDTLQPTTPVAHVVTASRDIRRQFRAAGGDAGHLEPRWAGRGQHAPAAPVTPAVRRAPRRVSATWAMALTALVGTGVLALWGAVIQPKVAFGSASDYLALFITGATASAATGVAGALAAISPES